MADNEFKTEWALLQNQFDSYEKHSLYIKLTSIVVLFAAQVTSTNTIYMLFLLLVLWLQDAIWKTFQSRIETRLLQIEIHIAQTSKEGAFQFNSEYQKIRFRGMSLIKEYVSQAVRPTVAFPHAVLILISLVHYAL